MNGAPSFPAGVWVDLLVLFLLLLGVWQGRRNGLKAEVVRAIAGFAAIVMVWFLHPVASRWMVAHNVWDVAPIAIRIALLIASGILFFILTILAGTFFSFIVPAGFSPEADHALGALPGLVRGALYAAVALLLIAFLPARTQTAIRENSHAGRFILPRLALDKLPPPLNALAPPKDPN